MTKRNEYWQCASHNNNTNLHNRFRMPVKKNSMVCWWNEYSFQFFLFCNYKKQNSQTRTKISYQFYYRCCCSVLFRDSHFFFFMYILFILFVTFAYITSVLQCKFQRNVIESKQVKLWMLEVMWKHQERILQNTTNLTWTK